MKFSIDGSVPSVPPLLWICAWRQVFEWFLPLFPWITTLSSSCPSCKPVCPSLRISTRRYRALLLITDPLGTACSFFQSNPSEARRLMNTAEATAMLAPNRPDTHYWEGDHDPDLTNEAFSWFESMISCPRCSLLLGHKLWQPGCLSFTWGIQVILLIWPHDNYCM